MAACNDDYERLIGPIQDRMIHSIWRILDDANDAEDALQDALVTILGRLKRIRRHPNPQALILKICVNAAYDTLRQRGRRKTATICQDTEDPSGSVEDQLMHRERRAQIVQAVQQLSRKQATAVLMRDMQDQSYQDIAQALGCHEATARKHVSRARARLARVLSHLLIRRPKEENGNETTGN